MIIPPRALKCLKSPENGQRMDFMDMVQTGVEIGA